MKHAERHGWYWAVVLLLIGGALAYLIWPHDITEVPLASVTVGGVLRLIASIAIALVFLVWALDAADLANFLNVSARTGNVKSHQVRTSGTSQRDRKFNLRRLKW